MEYLHDLTESPEDIKKLKSFDREYPSYEILKKTEKTNWKLAAAGFGAILSAGILIYSAYQNIYKNPVESSTVEQSQQQTHNQPIKSDLSDKFDDELKLK